MKLSLMSTCASPNALTVSRFSKFDMSKSLRLVTALVAVIASSSATNVFLHALVKMSRSETICLDCQKSNLRLERIKVLDSDSRLSDDTELDSQKVAELDNGDRLGLEWPANVADFLNECRIISWQFDIGRPLWWRIRNLLKGVETRRTVILLRKASYLTLASAGGLVSAFFSFKNFISLSNVKLEIGPETSKKGMHTPKQAPKHPSTSGGS